MQDYDCFYASVFENENPALRSLPLGVQQKQIIVTCNYEARRRGLHKLQLITEAKKICPDIVIVLGEDLTKFRNASKMLYKYLESFTWNNKVERLGMDEVWLDVTDLVQYNKGLLTGADLQHSWFVLDKEDPMKGFQFDATTIAGEQYPKTESRDFHFGETEEDLSWNLMLGSHLAQHIRHKLDEEKGYTSTVGISTSKLLSKLAGNVNKPKNQTTLMPPYSEDDEGRSNVATFIDGHDIGKIPGIGSKIAQKLRNHVLADEKPAEDPSIYGDHKDAVKVRDVRLFPGMGPQLLDKVLGGAGAEKGIGGKIWGMLNGVDDTEVQRAKRVPTQISIEDSYGRLETMTEVRKELTLLAKSLISRMRIDLLEDDDEDPEGKKQKWLAHPKTLRLSTRPRPPANSGASTYSSKRITRSAPLPGIVFNLKDSVDSIAEKLTSDTLMPMFRRLHDSKGWNLSLMNVCVTNMVETAGDEKACRGRDISRMFKHQEEAVKLWKVEDRDVPPDLPVVNNEAEVSTSEEASNINEVALDIKREAEPSAGNDAESQVLESSKDIAMSQREIDEDYDDEEDWPEDSESQDNEHCEVCGAGMPSFAMAAHRRFHGAGDKI